LVLRWETDYGNNNIASKIVKISDEGKYFPIFALAEEVLFKKPTFSTGSLCNQQKEDQL